MVASSLCVEGVYGTKGRECIEEDTLIFEVNLVEDNGMLDDDDDVDKRARTQRQPPPLPAKTGSIRSIVGRETESAKKSKFT